MKKYLAGASSKLKMVLDDPYGFLTRQREHLLLGVLITTISVINLIWIWQDQDRMLTGDSYLYLRNLLVFIDEFSIRTIPGLWTALGKLSVAGRPPGYQLLTAPFVLLFGRSEDAALTINLVFLAILMISAYNIGRIAKNAKAGLLGAFLVASYAPIIHFSRTYLAHFGVPACVALSLWFFLRMLRDRSVKTAWLFTATLGFGLLIHPLFAYILGLPVIVFCIYAILFHTHPRHPAGFAAVPAWLVKKLREPFVLCGLLPGTLVALGAVLAWYLTKGIVLIDVLRAVRETDALGESRMQVVGFPGIEPTFWWYAKTAPGAISNVLTIFLIIGLLFAVVRPRLTTTVLSVTLISSYTVLSVQPTLWWLSGAAMLPMVACLSVVWVADIRRRWLSIALTVICVVVAAFNLSTITLGVQPWNEAVATSLRYPSLGKELNHSPIVGALCSNKPKKIYWPAGEVSQAIMNASDCREDRPCVVLAVYDYDTFSQPRLAYHLAVERLNYRIWTTIVGHKRMGNPFNLNGLFKNEFILYPDLAYESADESYVKAAVRFLRSPPGAFANAHQTVATFQYPAGQVVLLKRIKPLTVEEVETSVAALELNEAYMSQKFAVLKSLGVTEPVPNEEVIALHQQTLAKNPDNLVVRLLLSDAYVKVGNTEAAIAELETAIARAPKDASPYTRLAGIYLSQGKNEQARQYYHQASVLDPSQVWNHFGLAEVYTKTGNPKQAVTSLQTVLALDPKNNTALVRLAELYRSMSKADNAASLYVQVLNNDPDNVLAYIKLSEIHKAAGNTEAAIDQLETAMTRVPDDPWPCRRLAEIYLSMDQNERALQLYEQAVELGPNEFWSRLGLAAAYQKVGKLKLEQAVPHLQAAVALEPKNTMPRLRLAGLYLSLGEREKAIFTYEHVLQIDPGNSTAQQALASLRE